ncbi:MAG: DUF3750 domain-containing protein [Woeseiaceae bacterium]|nr:DUF3750 domain-containing protein [Woeseiaceae bacterium]
MDTPPQSAAPLRWFGRGIVTLAAFAATLWWAVPWALEPTPIGPSVAPDPERHAGAVIQVYGADVIGVRGRYAIHTWIATKPAGADRYRIHEVVGWQLRRSRSAVRVSAGDPARHWFGAPPVLLHDLRGPAAEALIDDVHEAIALYPFAQEYTMWPGPNSNSFIAWVGLAVPDLGLDLPTKAIGQNWMKQNFAKIESGPDDADMPADAG